MREKVRTWARQGMIAVCCIALVALGGCASPQQWRLEGGNNTFVSEEIEASIIPGNQDYSGYQSFFLSIKNKSGKSIEVDWNSTMFIQNGQTSGGFMFEGITYLNRAAAKPNDVIFPGSLFQKYIFPNNLVGLAGSSWFNRIMPEGRNGVYLVLDKGGEKQTVRMTVNMRMISAAEAAAATCVPKPPLRC